jgi:DENN (AEX-3) domain
MTPESQDYQYWVIRKNKITEEFHELQRIKTSKIEELEQQKKIQTENQKKINELKKKIEDLKFEMNQTTPRISVFDNPTESIISVSTPTLCKKNFHRQITREFEHDPKELEELKSEEVSEKIFDYFLIIGKKNNNDPEAIYSFPPDNVFLDSPQGRVLGNFVFPVGIKTNKIKESKIIEELKKSLEAKIERNGKHFVVTVKSDIEKPPVKYKDRANYKREVLYCCCVVVDELEIESDQNYSLQPRSYCLVSYFPCFELQFKILFAALNKKITAEKELLDKENDLYTLQSSRQKILIGDYRNYVTDLIAQAYDMTINSRQLKLGSLVYNFPNDLGDLDVSWFCPLLFSLLSLDDFLFILFAVLQETSVIFLSQNMDYLSSCVLGFQGLIRPYSWPHLLIPIIPLSLLDLLDAPIPLLVGIPKNPQIALKKLNHLLIVDLDNKNINRKVQSHLLSSSKLSIPNIKTESLISSYKIFNTGPCYNPTSTHLKHSKKIIEKIKSYVRSLLVNLGTIQSVVESNNIRDFDSIIQLLKEQNSDHEEFRNNFYSTQMCINAVEEYYSLRSNNGKTFELS